MEEPEPHHDHIHAAHDTFRKAGFTLAAMRHKRTPEQLKKLKRFNGLSDDAAVPFAWGYFPNEWCATKGALS